MLNVRRLEQRIETAMAAGHVPAVAVAVVRGDDVIYARGFGHTAVEKGVVAGMPVTPDTVFRIGSVTKPLTATAAMRLVEQGKLDLDAPLTQFVPWLRVGDAKGAGAEVTMRMLLTHTSGLRSDAEHFGPRDPAGLETFVRDKIPTYSFVAPPGKLWSYSNPGFSLAGYILQVVAGIPFAQVMQELVFDPLGMSRTTFDPLVAMTYPLAQSRDCEDGVLTVQHRFADNVGHYPAGFAMSTVNDLAAFALMQMHEGRLGSSRLLEVDACAEMQRPQADLYLVEGTGYGLGFFVQGYKGAHQVGHSGGISTFVATLQMVPEAEVAVILLSNRDAPELAPHRIVGEILDEMLGLPAEAPSPEPQPADKALWGEYVGRYLGEDTGLAQIRAEDDALVLELNHEPILLQALRPDLYFGARPRKGDGEAEAGWISVGFVDDATLMVDGAVCHRTDETDRLELDAAALSAYAGTYASDFDTLLAQVDADLTCLVLASKAMRQDVVLAPLDEDRFTCQFGVVRFSRDDTGQVTALAVAGADFPRVPEPIARQPRGS